MHSKYALEFKPSALKEWQTLAPMLQEQFKKKLKQRLDDPHVQSDALSGLVNCHKIKLRNAGYRPVYEVEDDRIVVTVVAIGKRERGEVYSRAHRRT